MSKTFGQLLDEYLADELKSDREIQSAYMYMDGPEKPMIVICLGEPAYDWQDILFKSVDLKERIVASIAEVGRLQAKIRQLEKSKKEVSKAIALITKHAAPITEPIKEERDGVA